MIHSFPAFGDNQLPLEIGEYVYIVEETDNWFRGKIADILECSLGIFPKSYVHVCSDLQYKERNLKPQTTLERTILM